VRSAISLLEQNGYLTLTDEHEEPAKMMFECSRDMLYNVHAGGNEMDILLRTLLRKYDGLFTRFRSINELEVAAEAGLSHERVHELMKMLWRMHIIRYIPANNSPMLFFNSERLPTKDIYISPLTYQHRRELMLERYNSIVQYITNDDECRSRVIENYFGDKSAKPCGVCDNCLKARKSKHKIANITESVMKLLAEQQLDIKEVVAHIDAAPNLVIEIVEELIGEEKISMSLHGKLKINS
jgi:ATP-dependent DNA helicase RecQ